MRLKLKEVKDIVKKLNDKGVKIIVEDECLVKGIQMYSTNYHTFNNTEEYGEPYDKVIYVGRNWGISYLLKELNEKFDYIIKYHERLEEKKIEGEIYHHIKYNQEI